MHVQAEVEWMDWKKQQQENDRMCDSVKNITHPGRTVEMAETAEMAAKMCA